MLRKFRYVVKACTRKTFEINGRKRFTKYSHLRKHELITNIKQLEEELNALTVLSIDLLPEKEIEDDDHSRTAEIILDL